jgi:hypothetical protein
LLGFGDAEVAIAALAGDVDAMGDELALLPLLQLVNKKLTAKKQLKIQRIISFKLLNNL